MGEDKGLSSRRSARRGLDEDALATRREDARARAARARRGCVLECLSWYTDMSIYELNTY